jgi:hypothetical protein
MTSPLVGSVWGVPDRPETWRRVKALTNKSVHYSDFYDRDFDTLESWSAWLASSGAVEITELVKEKR